MNHRSLYTLLLIAGALVQLGCATSGSRPGAGTPAAAPAGTATAPSSTAAAAGDGTLLGAIGPGDEGAAPAGTGAPTAGAAAAGAAGTSGAAAATSGAAAGNAAAGHNGSAASAAAQAQAQAQAAQALAAQCEDLRAQIRGQQVIERAAPSTSIDEDIVAATIGKADKRIDQLQQKYDSLGCPDSELPPTHDRVPVLPPAPGALPP